MNRYLSMAAAGILGLVAATPAAAFDVDGALQWSTRLVLSTTVSGVVVEAPAVAGQRVAKGALLVRLDARPFEARKARAAAAVAGAKAALDEARREMERAEELYDRTVLSDHELQKAKIGQAAAEATFESARAEHTLATVDLERSRLTAPFDAWVLARPVEVGETVVSRLQARPLVVLAEADKMAVQVAVGADRAANIAPGMAVVVKVDGEQYEGWVRTVAMEPPEGSGLYPVEVEFTIDQPLRAGQRATVGLP
ncbi:efflux RND transporter periplasmic adaptor subunit [Endothiovibrio diazotrophicus]